MLSVLFCAVLYNDYNGNCVVLFKDCGVLVVFSMLCFVKTIMSSVLCCMKTVMSSVMCDIKTVTSFLL